MKMIFALVIMAAISVTVIRADETNAPATAPTNSAPIRISTADADKHIDESAVVTGKVVSVSIRPTIVFLNMDKAYPDSPFTAVIMAKNTNGFGDLKALEGKSVEVTGKIKSFHDKPEIVVDSTNHLTVLPE